MKIVLMTTAILIGALLLMLVYRSKVTPLPQCNKAWPQSYSNLVIQPCPTPVVK